jgi:putative ABC transport system permease protein
MIAPESPMRLRDTLRFGSTALITSPGRSAMILLAMVIGIASVIVLTSLGEGARRYVVQQFRSLGSNLLIVLPGRSETTGGMPPLFATAPHDLTIADSLALARHAEIRLSIPIIAGAADVSYGSKEREVMIVGTNHDYMEGFDLQLHRGRFLPQDDPYRASSVCVLGQKLYRELFGQKDVLGEWIRIGTSRFRIIGVLVSKGKTFSLDMSDTVIIPTASAQMLFDHPGLFRIVIKARSEHELSAARDATLRIIRKRHNGEEDITVLRQDAMIGTLDTILDTMTQAVGGIAAISLVVAGILIMNVMMVSVSQRKAEIGLLKALGASTGEVMRIFLGEALMLSLFGGLLGVMLGLGAVEMLGWALPDFPLATPPWAIMAALVVALATGLIFGGIPARKAARLHPVAALSGR